MNLIVKCHHHLFKHMLGCIQLNNVIITRCSDSVIMIIHSWQPHKQSVSALQKVDSSVDSNSLISLSLSFLNTRSCMSTVHSLPVCPGPKLSHTHSSVARCKDCSVLLDYCEVQHTVSALYATKNCNNERFLQNTARNMDKGDKGKKLPESWTCLLSRRDRVNAL